GPSTIFPVLLPKNRSLRPKNCHLHANKCQWAGNGGRLLGGTRRELVNLPEKSELARDRRGSGNCPGIGAWSRLRAFLGWTYIPGAWATRTELQDARRAILRSR